MPSCNIMEKNEGEELEKIMAVISCPLYKTISLIS
jgi:hypothetical protein